jgi:uncharacterized membrane protein
MTEVYRIVFTGNVSPDRDIEQVIGLFSEKFKLERAMAEKVIKAGKPISLKKGLALEKAERYLKVLQQIGIEVEIDPKPPEPEPALSAFELEPLDHGGSDTTEVLEHPTGIDRCPKCGSSNMEMGICQDCGIVAAKYLAAQAGTEGEVSDRPEPQPAANPYSAPEADLVEPMENEMTGPTSLPAGNGFSWIGKGWWHFKTSPFAWIGALVVWFIISMVLGFIPVLGSIISILIGPIIMAGFMYGCAEQDAGGDFSVSHLFSGFSGNVGQLMLVAVFYFIMLVLAVVIMAGGVFVLAGGAAALENPEMGGGAMIGLLLLGFLLFMPIMMSYIFAPALVMLDEMSAFEAMKYSFSGCIKNILPLIVYFLVAIVLLFVGVIPIGLGLLIVLPMLTAGTYAAYRDIYFS